MNSPALPQEPRAPLPAGPTRRCEEPLRILLVDDHSLIRTGLRTVIAAQPDMEVTGEAADGEQALQQAREGCPDVVVMDVALPGMSGTEATREIKRHCPRTLVLGLSMHEDTAHLRGLLEAGASGYMLKRSAPQELIHAIRSIATGGTYLDPAFAGKVASRLVLRPAAHGGAQAQKLSEREETVLRLAAQGHTSREIGGQLGISAKSVETYKARGEEKLGIKGRTDLVRYATQHGWLADL